MRWKSFLQFFTRGWRKKQPINNKPVRRRNARLLVELLEQRELLAGDIPTILAAGVMPTDGSSINTGSPIIQVQFSETMSSSALNAANYVLLGSSGNNISVDSVAFEALGGAPVNSAVRISYNGGSSLVVDNYTLFVRGDRLTDADDGFAMAQPGQLIVANSGRNNVAVVGLPGDGSLGAISPYNLPAVGTQAANPYAVALGDFDADGINDLAVVNAGTNQVLIYQGQSVADGAGYNLSADLTLNLPAGTANLGKSILLTDLTKDGKLDLVVANVNTSNLSVFLNTSTSLGTLSFSTANTFATDANPVGIVAGDFDGDTNVDLAVAVSTAPSDIGGPNTTADYRINILPGDGVGGFGVTQRFRVGDAGPADLVAPSSIGAGLFNLDNRLDFVVGGSNGFVVLVNASTPTNFAFNLQTPNIGTSSIVSLAVGNLDADNSPDVVAATTLNTLEIYRNTGTGGAVAFMPVSSIAVAAGSTGRVVIGDMNRDGKGDIILSNGAAAGRVTLLQNTTVGGSISAATNSNPIVITSARNGLKTGQSVIISGATGNTAANNGGPNPATWTVTVINGTVATATGPGGGMPISINSLAHGLTNGESVTISGNPFAAANGTFTVTVVDNDNFTLNGTSAAGSGNGGTWSSNDRFSLNTSNGNNPYTGGATWVLAGNLTGNIADVTGNGVSPIVITSRNHGLVSGEQVSVNGVLGNTNANAANWTITVIDADRFSLNTSTGNGNYAGGGNWNLLANITNTTGNATSPIVVTSFGHGLVSGQRVTITGVTGNTNANNTWTITVPGASINTSSGVGANPISINSNNHGLSTGDRVVITGNSFAAANGTFFITVADTNNFTLNGTSAIGSGTGGSWTNPDRFSLNASTGNGAYAGGGLWALTGNISNTSGTGVAPIVITSNGHGLTSGQSVTVAGVTGNTNANGTWIVTVLTSSTFSLNGSPAGNANYISGGTWTRNYATSSASNTSPIVITSNNHGLVTGTQITIAGVTGNTAANGTFTVTVLDQDHFFLNGTTGNGNYVNGGTWTTATSFYSTVATASAVGAGGVNPIAITTTSPHNLANGTQVTFSGMTGNLASVLNGNTFTVTVTDSTHFTLNNTTAAGSASGGFFTTSTGAAGPALSPYTVDNTPIGVAVGDTNQDGLPDLVVANNTGNDFTVMLGAGNGALKTGTNYAVTPTVTSGVAIADLNNDGFNDLAIINNNGSNNSTFVTILQGQADGTYAAPINFSPLVAGFGHNMRNLVSITVANVNGDTHSNGAPKLDIIVADSQDNTVGFLRNNLANAGDRIVAGSFTAIDERGVGQTPTQVVMGDFNNDGKLDLAVSHNRGGGGGGGNRRGITIRLGNGDFTFQNSFELDNGTPMSAVVLGDFNKDGNLDVIGAEDNAPGNIRLHFGDGKGGFGNNGTFATGVPNPGSIEAADFNGDGFLDIIVTSKSTGLTNAGVAVLLNQLGTGFGTALQSDVIPGTALQDVVVTDVNQDGFADAVVSTQIPVVGGAIQNVTNAGGLIEIRVFGNHNLNTGQQVTISGVNGTVPANGTWTITVTSGSRFTLNGSSFSGSYTGGGTWALVNTGATTNENVFVLMGKGNGSFESPVPYLAGGVGAPAPAPSYLGVTPSSLIRVTTFASGGAIVNTNLVNNGDFEARDLNNEQGNLLGWQTFNLNTSPGGSLGNWLPQTGTSSPLSGTTVPAPTAKYRAMLDQNNQVPYTGNNNPNNAASYQGSHAIYQDITIPANASKVTLSLSLYIDNTDSSSGYSDTSTNTTLDFRTSSGGSVLANQQVRVDIMRPSADILSVSTIPQRSGSVASASETGGVNPIMITTTAPHGLATGSLVTISGVLGYAAANGTFTITVIDATHFTLNGTSTPGNSTGSGAWSVPGDILRNEFITVPTTPVTFSGVIQDADLTAFAGQTIRLRIATANNQGRLIVGVDNVSLLAQFGDTAGPSLNGLNISNPAFISAGIPHTNDPTLIGTIADNSGLNSIAFIEFDLANNGFGGPGDLKITNWDAQGNFRQFLSNTPAGFNTIGVQVVDKAGNATASTFTFFMQSNSVTEWEAVGPQGIDVTGKNVDYTKVSGRVTVAVPDLNDPLGNSYFVGSANGGIWKTTNGGSTWVSVTNDVTDGSGNPIPVSVGGMAQSRSNPSVLYAATGVGDRALDSRPGVGVLKSVDGGKTWTLIGNSGTVLGGARVVKVVVDANTPDIAYVGTASNGAGTSGGVFKTTDGGLTWVNILNPATMRYLTDPTNLATLTPLGAAGAPVDSVTDLIIDPATSNHLVVALGSIGLVPARGATGVWQTSNAGAGWTLVQGGDNGTLAANTLPNEPVGGTRLGRTIVGIGQGRTAAQTYLYVLVGSPPGNNTPPNVNWGAFTGLYRSKDVGLNFTRVMLKADYGAPGVHSFQNVQISPSDASNAGALLVDPSNPNVVYVGGSSRWNTTNPNTAYNFIRVDTGNMRDTTYFDQSLGTIPNDGDDIDKANRAENQGGKYDPSPGPATDNYVGEGVYWYNLDGGASGERGQLDSLPDAITSLAIDSQGRLLVGTNGGIWRGVPYGFGYDFTSGDEGILAQGGPGGGNQFSTQGMTFTSINGNLQIADMTSVAIDPFNRGVLYTTQIDTGTAVSTAPLAWVSQDLELNGILRDIPNAGTILSANPAPGSPAGTPVSLYRIWQYADQAALSPQTSIDNGASWNSINSGGISINATAGVFPAFAINPTPILQSGLYQTALAFGANVVYTTDTSATAWFQSSGVLSAGANISALTFASSDASAQTLYAATDNGRLFRTIDKGGDGWPAVDTGLPIGLPNTFIRGIAVDPNNANELFVMYSGNGTANHVWHSTNGGATWTSVSGTLPSVSAYAMVIDRTPGLGAPIGKLYLATEVGVFYSLDNGANWIRLGQGMPNVPVVDLKFDGTRASGGVSTAVGTGGVNPIVITTTAPHGRSTGDAVAITGVSGFAAANGNFTITVIDATRYSLDGTTAVGNGAGGTWTVPGLQVLAAATLGRGVYTINTSAFSFIADQTVDQNMPSKVIPFTINNAGTTPYTLTATSDNQFLVQDSAIVLGGGASPAADRTIQFTPVLNANTPNNGVANITVTITSGSFTFQQSFKVTVNFVNQLPTISGISNPQTTVVNTPLTVGFTIGDVETAAGSLQVTATSNNAALIPNANLVLGGSGPNRTLTLTPLANQVGSATIQIAVTDGNFGITNFTFDLQVVSPASLPFSDDFNRANGTFIGPYWTVNTGPVTLQGSQVNFGAGLGIASLNQLTPPAADISLRADIDVGTNENLGLIARYNGGVNNFYQGAIVNTGGAYSAVISKNVNGVTTTLASVPVGFGTGTLSFEVAADSLRLYYGSLPTNMVLVAFANDTSLTAAGTAGFRSASGNVTLDNFFATAINLTTPTMPFTDNFNLANGSQLSPNWVNRLGNFAINSNVAVANSSVSNSLATLAGLNQTNGTAQADVNVVGSQTQAGVVVRYSNSGYYYAQIFNTGSGFTANIFRIVGNTATAVTAGAVDVSAIGAAGTVRLEVVGTALKMFYGPNPGNMTLVNFGYDSMFASGSSGIRASAGLTVNDFVADAITLKTPNSLPFDDHFNDAVNGNQLYGDASQLSGPNERHWQDQAGNFIVTGGVLKGNSAGAARNFATVAGNIGETAVSASVVVDPANGQEAGVVARYTAAGYYYAQIRSTGSGFVATIFRANISNGTTTFTQLSTTNVVAGGTGIATLEATGPSLKFYFNNTLAAFGFDSSFAAGAAGVRASMGATTTLDDFQADAITLTAPASLPFTDNFNAPIHGNQLSRDWTERQGNFAIDGAQQVAGQAAGMNIATVNGPAILDASVEAKVITGQPSQNVSLIARYQANGNYYVAGILSNAAQTTFTPYIAKFINGAFAGITTTLATPAAPLGVTGTMVFEVSGTSLKLFWNDALVMYGYDSQIAAAGLTGLRTSQSVILDDFTIDTITPATPSLAFNHDFSTSIHTNQLLGNGARNWDDRLGNFIVNGAGQAVANDPTFNIATVHGISIADAALQADVIVDPNQHAGLVARFQANGTFYVGLVQATANGLGIVPSIWTNASGTFTRLSPANTPAITIGLGSSHTLRFEAVGSSFKLFVDGNLATYAYSSAITAPGAAGIRASKNVASTIGNAFMDNFSLDNLVLSTPTIPPAFTDDFSAPVNTNQLSRNWVDRLGNFSINGSGQAVANDPTFNIATVNGVSFTDAVLEANVVVDPNQHAGLVARFQANGTFYVGLVQATADGAGIVPGIWTNAGGNFHQINPANTPAIPIVPGSAHTLRFEAAGTSFKLFVDNNLATYGYNSEIMAAGAAGIRASRNVANTIGMALMDDFSLNQITLNTPTLPYQDPFTQAANTPFSADWTERQGLFNFTGTALQAVAAGTSIATVNTPVADSSTQIDTNTPLTGTHYQGVVARFSAGTGNTYVGMLFTSNGTTTAFLFKRIGGSFTQIGAGVNVAASGAGTLRLDVVGSSIKLFYGPNAGSLALATHAIDTQLSGPGLSGVYMGQGATATNFDLRAITLNTPILPFSDPFTGANGTQLSRDWIEVAGNYSVSANRIVGNGSPINLALVNGNNVGPVNVDAEITVGAGQFAGVVARYQANGSFYTAFVLGNGGSSFTAYLYRFDAGVGFTLLTSAPVASGVGTLSLRAVGANLKVFYGASLATQALVAFAYDTMYASGLAGIRSNAGANLDNFTLSQVAVPGSQPATYNETFAVSPPTQQLSTNWLERAGNFNLATGKASGQAANNIATIQGINAVNVDLSAVASLTIPGEAVSLIARYSGNPGVDSYYAATVTFVGVNNYKVELNVYVNGVKRPTLATTNVASFTSGIRFLAVNSNLNVYLDNSALPALTVVDGTILTAGAVGMGANAGGKFSQFSAS